MALMNSDPTSTLRLPVQQESVKLTLGDGSTHRVDMYVPLGRSVEEVLRSASRFVTTATADGFKLFARDAIACVAIESVVQWRDDLPREIYEVSIHLDSGHQLAGELRFISNPGYNRPVDYLNGAEEIVELHAGGQTHYVSKSHINFVEERS